MNKKDFKKKSVFVENVVLKTNRKMKSDGHKNEVWFGLGMMGLVGWSVVVPTLLGAVLGAWIDKHYSGEINWTLMLLIIGLTIGCLNAWHWIVQEDRAMQEEKDNDDI